MQVLQAANASYPAVAFAQSQNTGLFLSAPATLGVAAGGAEMVTVTNASTQISANAAPRLIVTSNALTMNLAFVSSQVAPINPLETAVYDLSAPQLIENSGLNNGSLVTAWGSASGFAAGSGTLPILKRFSDEPADTYVSFVGNGVTSGSYLNLGATTWEISSNLGFSCLAHVRFTSPTNNNYERLFEFGSVEDVDTFRFGRYKLSSNLAFSVVESGVMNTLLTTTPTISGTWQTLGCRLALLSNIETQTWGMTIFNNGANVAYTEFTSNISNKVATQSYIGRPWSNASPTETFTSMDMRSMSFFNYPLTDTEFSSLSSYEYAKFNTLLSYANAAHGSVLVTSQVGTVSISASGDFSSIRSVNGIPFKNFRHWSPNNLLKYDILGILQASRDSCPVSSSIDALRDVSASFPGSYTFFGAVLLQDRRVFIVPHNATSGRIYDPMADTLLTSGGSFPGMSGFMGGVLLGDGRVFCVPYLANQPTIYDPTTNSTTVGPLIPYSMGGAYSGGVLLDNGSVFCSPSYAANGLVYDPYTNTLSYPTTTGDGVSDILAVNYKFQGAVLMSDNRVFCVPYEATRALIYDSATNAFSLSAATFPGSGAYYGGVLLPNGSVFCIPHNASQAAIYDPITDSVTYVGSFPGSYAFAGGCLLPCGRVLCVPYGVSYCMVYDPTRDIVTRPAGTFPENNGYAGAVLLSDGRAFIAPCNATVAKITNTSWGAVPVPVSVLTSPYVNKF